MGSSVNYVVVDGGEHTLYALGGGAGDGIDYCFAPGPDIVLRWLANAQNYIQDHWFDDVLCYGGVLIDVDRKVLLTFNRTFSTLAYRTAMLQAYASTWPGWQIRWAFDGIADLMAYVGLDESSARHEPRPTQTEANMFSRNDAAQAVLSVRRADGKVRAYGLNHDLAGWRWWMGPDLIDWADAGPRLRASSAVDDVRTGLHLDLATRSAGLWSVKPLCGLRQRWAELWPGWSLDDWEDDMDRQAAHIPGLLPTPAPAQTIRECRDRLADRVWTYWPVRSTMKARGVDVDFLYKLNFAGVRSHLDAQVSAAEMRRVRQLLRGPKTTA